MSENFNKLWVQIECMSLQSRAEKPMIEATYALMMDVEPPKGHAPRNLVLSEVFDSTRFRVYLNPSLKRRVLREDHTPWMEARWNTKSYLEEGGGDSDFRAITEMVNGRFSDLIQRSWDVKVRLHEKSMEQTQFPGMEPPKGDPNDPATWELVPFHFVDWSYIRESCDFTKNGWGRVTMVHCQSPSDVFVAYCKYSAYTKLGRSL